MKHIKLYESFNSKILSGTLGHIKDVEGRNNFLTNLRKICKSIDYPMSNLTDDFFEYLPFKSALNKFSDSKGEKCNAKSILVFPDHGIEGSVCTDGKIKRKWGSSVREVPCPVCNGSGIRSKKPEVKLIKFWFNYEGKYVSATAVDGNIIKKAGSLKLSDYEIVKHIELEELSTGDIVYIDLRGTKTIAYIYKPKNDYRCFAIQNVKSGGTPNDSIWRKFGNYSWCLGSIEDYTPPIKLLKRIEVEDDVIDPYSFNFGLSNSLASIGDYDVREAIKEAHFAIILNIDKLRRSEYKLKSKITSSRSDIKKDSKLDSSQRDENIRKKNIERYMDKLSKSLSISDDIKNCNKLILKSIGYKGALYVINYSNTPTSNLINLISYYISLFKDDLNTSQKEDYISNINRITDVLFRNGMKRSKASLESIEKVKGIILSKSISNEEKDKYINMLVSMQELSNVIYERIKSYQIDSIEDLEIVTQKIISIRNIVRNADRYELNKFFAYILDNITEGYESSAANKLTDTYYTGDNVIKNLDRLKIIFSKI